MEIQLGKPGYEAWRTMKVLDITTFYSTGRGGITTYLERKSELTSRLAGDMLHHVLVLGGATDQVTDFHGSRCYWIKSRLSRFNSNYRVLRNFSKIFNVLKREQPDIVETPDPYWILLYLLLMRRMLKRMRLFFFYRSDFPDTYVTPFFAKRGLPRIGRIATRMSWWYARRVLNRVDRVLVHSEVMKNKLVKQGIKAPIEVVGNLTDFNAFLNCQPNAELLEQINQRFGSVGPILLYCGRLSVEKGIEVLLEGFAQLRQEIPDAILLTVGSGELEAKIRQLADDTSKRIYCLPATSDRRYLASIFAMGDVMVASGPHETFSMVTLEAIVSELPVVGFDGTGGISALIQPGVGFLADQISGNSLKSAMLKALAPKSDWYRDDIRQSIVDAYRPERVYQKILDTYGFIPATVDPVIEQDNVSLR